jgi:hypothetical protein
MPLRDGPRRFIQVGAHTGPADKNDLSHNRGLRGLRNWAGLLIEADPTTFPTLASSMCSAPGAKHVCVNRAICTSGREPVTVPFFALASTVDRRTLIDSRTGLAFPSWAAQTASFNRSAVLAHETTMRKAMYKAAGSDRAAQARVSRFQLAEYVSEHSVLCQTLDGLLAQRAAPHTAHARAVGIDATADLRGFGEAELLIIDTEGFDAHVVLSLELTAFRPRFIVFEHVHLSRIDLTRAARHLRERGYDFQPTAGELQAHVLRPVAKAAARRPAQLYKAVWSQLKSARKRLGEEFNCIPFLTNSENVFAARRPQPGEVDPVMSTGGRCAAECPDRSVEWLQGAARQILGTQYGEAYLTNGTMARRPTW